MTSLTRLPPATRREWLLVTGVSLAIITAITWPLVPHLGSVGRLDSGDGRFSIWNVAWVAHALTTHPTGLFDANIFSPHQGTLAYSEMNLVAGVLALPAFVVTHSALAAHNFAVVVGLLLSMVCTWVLVRRLTGSSGAGFVSATLFTFCSYLQGHTAHVQLLMIFVIPLVMLAFHRVRDRPTASRAVQLGLAVAVAGLACGYYGIYGGLVLGVAALVFATRDRRYWLALGGACAMAAIVVAPIYVRFVRARAASGAAPTRNAAMAEATSADLHDYVSSPTRIENLIITAHWDAPVHDYLSPGPVLFLLVLVSALTWSRRDTRATGSGLSAARTRWGYVAITVFAAWVSFGPAAGLYTVLMRIVPGMDFLRAPSRMGVNVIFGLAVLAGFGARVVIAERHAILVALVAVCALDRYAGWYLTEAEPIPKVYRVLHTLPVGVVVDYPFSYVLNDLHQHTKAMYDSTVDWMPRVNGYSDVLPPDFLEIAAPINEFPDLPTFGLLRKYHVRYVVWQIDPFKRDPAAYGVLTSRLAAAAAYVRPIYKDDTAWLYEIVGWPPEAGQ